MSLDSEQETIPFVSITFTLNGNETVIEVPPRESALYVLRDLLGLIGTKEGCGIGECGACTILVDGHAVNACLMLAPQLDGQDVETIEGTAADDMPDSLQQSFLDHGAVQCGFCTPGVIMSARALLNQNPSPKREDIVEAISGNLCRCTGYQQMVDAIEAVAARADRTDEALDE
jgi:carbon-monoxide dehydrogenase small subunit